MTADIELLPLSEYLYGREASDNERVVTIADAHAYAFRNVAHHTAAKDAEIEALRAEREVIAAEAVKYADKSGRLEARAERLAEALRALEPFAEHHDRCGDHDAYNNSPVRTCGCGLDALLERIAALRDHDKEARNG